MEPADDPVAVRERSRWRLARTFSTTAWPSAVTSWRPLDRNAATATDRASSGSVLFVSPASSSRTRAASLGCTSSTARRRRPAAGPAAAQPAGAFHRPGPLRPGLRPGNQRPGPVRAGPHPQLAQRLPGRADRHRGVRALMRAGPDHHCHQCTPSSPATDGPRRACLIPDLRWARVPLSSHATEGPTEQAHRSKARHTAGRRFGSQPRRTSGRYVNRSAQSGWSLRRNCAAP